MSLSGWMGKILRVDLTSGGVTVEPLKEELMLSFIGGRGINSSLLYSETGPATDPLGPDNRLIIGTSPLTGTMVPASGRFTVTAKSPLTGILGDANAGGKFGPELKYAGYDFLIIQGVSDKPVYLCIEDDHVEIRDAGYLWGRTTQETDKMIKEEIGDSQFKVLVIGPAGENLVKIAAILSGFNSVSECGLGAVMGSKKLKAIAVKGSHTVSIANPDKMLSLVDAYYEDYKNCESWDWYPKHEWTTNLRGYDRSGCSPIKNFLISGGNDLEKREVFYDVETSSRYRFKDLACFACPLACNKWVYTDKLGMKKHTTSGMATTPLWEIYDYLFLVKVLDLCNAYGLHLWSVQLAISAAMEWYEKGIITKKETDGLEVKFGSKDAVISLIHKIAKGEGFGSILGEGNILAGKIIGADPDTTPSCSYGLPADHGPVDCRAMAMLTLSFCISTRGTGLRSSPPMAWGQTYSMPEKWKKVYRNAGAEEIIDKPWVCHPLLADIVTYFEIACALADITEICRNTTEDYYFYGFEGREAKDDAEWIAQWIESVTGLKVDRHYMETVAKRVVTLERAYNVRQGKFREHDMPSHRIFEKRRGKLLDGRAINEEEFSRLLSTYYKIHDWDPETSVPTRKVLEELGLQYVADDLERIGLFG